MDLTDESKQIIGLDIEGLPIYILTAKDLKEALKEVPDDSEIWICKDDELNDHLNIIGAESCLFRKQSGDKKDQFLICFGEAISEAHYKELMNNFESPNI